MVKAFIDYAFSSQGDYFYKSQQANYALRSITKSR